MIDFSKFRQFVEREINIIDSINKKRGLDEENKTKHINPL